ncbi:hypothetical protein FQA39_LY02975 [Lamprigera yunnana]|nr:hypothetical protein FQA39_LY02975 [Lamprigera yunnana]
MFHKNKNAKPKKKPKLHLVFDEVKRRDFLTGFHKRKMDRKKKAREKFEKQFKEEKRRLKAEARESYKNLVKSYAPLEEVESILMNEFDDENVNVKVVELSTQTSDRIGANQPQYEPETIKEESATDDSSEDELPGMELDFKPTKPTDNIKEEPDEKENNFNSDVDIKKNVKKEPENNLKSNMDIKKFLKKQATKKVQKSRMFQKKNKIERNKQKRLSAEQKKLKGKNKKGRKTKTKGRNFNN